MKIARLWLMLPLAVSFGCAAQMDRVVLTASDGQKELVRDGTPSLISEKQHVVLLRPVANRQERSGRPRFVLAVLNRGKAPLTVHVRDVSARNANGKFESIRIYTYEELTAEVENKKKVALALAIIGGAAGAYSASQAGYSHTTGSIYGNGYSQGFSATTYNAAAAQYAADRNAAITGSNIANIQASGELQLAQLQETILKDHTLMPGEWHGGVIVLDPPGRIEKGAQYVIDVTIDGEVHSFQVGQQEV